MLTFDEATHSYKFGDKAVVSVTQILDAAGLISSHFYTEGSSEKGTFIHQACEALDKGNLDWFAVPVDVIPFVEAYEKFLKDTSFDIRMIEEKLYHSKLKFAGTVDRYGVLNGENFVIDLKSGAKQKWHSLQTAGYAILLEEPDVWDDRKDLTMITPARGALYLKENGTYKLETHDKANDYEFKQLVTQFHEKAV